MVNKAQNYEVAGARGGMLLTKHLHVRSTQKCKEFSILNYLRMQINFFKTTTIRIDFWEKQ